MSMRHRLLVVFALLALLAWQTQSLAQGTRSEPILLVAAPELADPNFFQTVVLVVFPDGAGPIGLVLNRPTQLQLKDAFTDEPQLQNRQELLYFGGPVRTNALWFLYRGEASSQGAFHVIADLYLSNNGDLLDALLAVPESRVQRFFLGYAGWAPVQLDVEIARGAWHVLPVDLDAVLSMDPKVMWRELHARATAVRT
jgi:putative transcriptional regulator